MTVKLSASDLLTISTVIEEYLGTPECCTGLPQDYIDRIDGIAQVIDAHLGIEERGVSLPVRHITEMLKEDEESDVTDDKRLALMTYLLSKNQP
jgi:hypothetical protein